MLKLANVQGSSNENRLFKKIESARNNRDPVIKIKNQIMGRMSTSLQHSMSAHIKPSASGAKSNTGIRQTPSRNITSMLHRIPSNGSVAAPTVNTFFAATLNLPDQRNNS